MSMLVTSDRRAWLSAPPARTLATLIILFACGACATNRPIPTRATLDADVRTRINRGIRVEGTERFPPGVVIDDGMTSQEAVAIALWNSPSFQATLADLGIARADVAEAGLLRNPVFSLLFPVGPKQLEWTLQFPFDAIWQRPKRVAAAQLNAQAVGERLVWDALGLVAQTRTAHLEAGYAEPRLELAIENAELLQRFAQIAEARLRLGDISELEARGARNEAARARVERGAAEHDRDLARLRLASLLGLDASTDPILARVGQEGDPTSCGTEAGRLEEALASRPDVRAAEIEIEAAAQRARWERSRVVSLIGMLDANRTPSELEVGPGVNVDVPIFARNQGGISRADAEIERAGHRYAAVRAQVAADVRSASVRVRQAEQALAAWLPLGPSLDIEQRQAEAAYQVGEIPLYSLLDVSRRRVDGHMRLLDVDADFIRATIALERSIGRYCQPR